MLSCRSRPSSSTRPYYCACPRTPSSASRRARRRRRSSGRARAAQRPVARGLRDECGAPARTRSESARRGPRGRARRRGVDESARRACGGRRARLRQPVGRAGVVPGRARGDPPRRPRLRLGVCGSARARPGRDGLGEPDRPDHGRVGAQRCVRRFGRAPARVRRRRGRASTTTTTPARRWSGSGRRWTPRARARPPEDGYHGAYITEVAQLEDPVGEMLKRIEESLERFGSTSTRGLCRASSSGGCRRSCLGSMRTRRTARCGRARRHMRTTATAC